MNLNHIDATVSAINLLCPLPILRLQRAINSLKSQAIIELRCTDPGVLHDVPAWCRIHGHTCLNIVEQNNEIIMYIKKGKEI